MIPDAERAAERNAHPLHLLALPYRDLIPVSQLDFLDGNRRLLRGSAVVWEIAHGDWGGCFSKVRDRAPGVALIMILPPSDEIESVERLLDAADRCRPHSILPYHPHPLPEELASVLRHPPESLPAVMMDYLTWRGLRVDIDTRRLVRRIVELSGELKSVRGVARSLHLSRRALGRRFRKWGLPVPSHVLHFSRILRASLALQNTSRTLFEIACRLGYTDGFALSNQMARMTGLRPQTVRKRAGWEWIVEAWLQTEQETGKIRLDPRLSASLTQSPRLSDIGKEPAGRWQDESADERADGPGRSAGGSRGSERSEQSERMEELEGSTDDTSEIGRSHSREGTDQRPHPGSRTRRRRHAVI